MVPAGAAIGPAVCVVGVGARTPLGLTAPASAAAVRAGLSAVREHPYYLDKAGEPMATAPDDRMPAGLDATQRLATLLRPALEEARAPAAGRPGVPAELPLVLGLPEPRPGLPGDLAARVTA